MLKKGQILKDTYRIEEEIGSGSGGTVYKAWHLNLNTYVAVKLIKDDVKDIIGNRSEADILKGLHHSNLPQVYDFIDDGEDIYTVMEYISGRSLWDEIAERGAVSAGQTLVWGRELASAAAYLHSRKVPIVHSDIKPQNIMIDDEDRLCLIDFNISAVFDGNFYTVGSSDGYSPPEQYVAVKESTDTVNYIPGTEIIDNGDTQIINKDEQTITAPSHTVSRSVIDTSSDVYSIGAVLYSCITGCKPANSRKEVEPVRKLAPEIPEGLEFIITKAMKKEKSERFSDAGEMLKALNGIDKLDRRYKSLKVRQAIMYVLIIALLGGSLLCMYKGKTLMTEEREEKYSNYIANLDAFTGGKDYTDFDNTLSAFSYDFPDDVHADYYKAIRLYDEENVEDAYNMAYPLTNSSGLTDKEKASMNRICADAFVSFGDYNTALSFYENAVNIGEPDDKTYLDYAVALVHCGDTAKAAEIADKAFGNGYADLIRSEIAYTSGNQNEALEYLGKITDGVTNADDNVLRHAYTLSAQVGKEMYKNGDISALDKCIGTLEKGIIALPEEYSMQLYEDLVQCYIDKGELTNDPSQFAKAVSIISDMKRSGWEDYQSEMNIAVLLDKLNSPENAKAVLLEMTENPNYSLHYLTIYVRLAYCEAKIQSGKDNNDRDYSKFAEYYKKAEQEYSALTARGDSDPDMERLRQSYEELVSMGWIK